MTVAEAADKIGISTSKMYQILGARLIGHYRIGGKIVVFDDDIAAYLQNCRVGAVTPVGAAPRVQATLKHLSARNQ